VTVPRWATRAAFVLYALVLFIATHWPKLAIEGEGRPDLWIHMAAFALWTTLLLLSGWPGRLDRPATFMRAIAIAAAYAALDEGLQAIPFLHRHVALDDLLANLAGVALGATAVVVAHLAGWLRRFSDPARPANTEPAAHDPTPPSE